MSLGYECFPEYKTLKETRKVLQAFIKEDIYISPFKLAKIKHDINTYELKIGSKQGYHTYSYYTIKKVRQNP